LSTERPFFTRAMAALVMTLGLAAVMALLGPVSASRTATLVSDEFSRRNGETMATVTSVIESHPKEWQQLVDKVPAFSELPTETERGLASVSDVGRTIFPSLLALESLAALALAWATYHRLGRTRLGAPLQPLREFRFNDQLVWGLIVGLTTILVPTLSTLRGFGQNLLVFFGTPCAASAFYRGSWRLEPWASRSPSARCCSSLPCYRCSPHSLFSFSPWRRSRSASATRGPTGADAPLGPRRNVVFTFGNSIGAQSWKSFFAKLSRTSARPATS
jgi:hypothetical protein